MADPRGPGRYRHVSFNAPLSDDRADALARRLAAAAPAEAVDIGCGWGELLLRILERSPSTVGVGIDVDEELIERGQSEADRRGLADRVRFVPGPADQVDVPPADLVICVGSSHAVGGPDRALEALWSWVRPGGRLLFGDGTWDRAATGDRSLVWQDMLALPDLAGQVDRAVAAGFRPLSVEASTTGELDAFESGFLADYEEWLVAHPDHPDAEQLRAKADEHRNRWLHGYRGGFGFAYLTLGRPQEPARRAQRVTETLVRLGSRSGARSASRRLCSCWRSARPSPRLGW